jgi:hypothetical protein
MNNAIYPTVIGNFKGKYKINISQSEWALLINLRNTNLDLLFSHIYKLAIQKCINGTIPNKPCSITNNILIQMNDDIERSIIYFQYFPHFIHLFYRKWGHIINVGYSKTSFWFVFNIDTGSREICYELYTKKNN